MEFFYDLPLMAARGEISSAITILYYGNNEGAFANMHSEKIELESIYALEIDLTPYVINQNKTYSFALIYFEKKWNEALWVERIPPQNTTLKSLTTKVEIAEQITNNPKHDYHIFSASRRDIKFSPFPEAVNSQVVPEGYVSKFNQRFSGYLMRSSKDFFDLHELFYKYQLTNVMHDYAESSSSDKKSVKMQIYSNMRVNAIA